MKRAAILLLLLSPLTTAQNSIKVQVRGQNGVKVIDLPTLERYVAAVLAGESASFQSKEALKAMAGCGPDLRSAPARAAQRGRFRFLRHDALPAC